MRRSFRLDRGNATPLYRQLVGQVEEAIRSGKLKAGERLPSAVDLAKTLGVNKATVVQAYRDLEKRRWMTSHVGRGTFVADRQGEASAAEDGSEGAGASSAEEWAHWIAQARASHAQAITRLASLSAREGILNLYSGMPAQGGVSGDVIPRAAGRALSKDVERLYGYAHSGLPEFVDELARWLGRRGYSLAPEQIIVTNGSQQAVSLVGTWLIGQRSRVLCETPTYLGIPRALLQYGHALEPVPWRGRELRMEDVERATRSGPSLLYCNPEFHNPTGECLSETSREELARIASRRELTVVVDDIFRDLRFSGRESPSLYERLPAGRRILIGSFSKSFLPGFRIGFLAADRPLAEEFHALRRIVDLGISTIPQALLAEFLRGGYQKHLEMIRRFYRDRCRAAVAAMERHFPEDVRVSRPEGGFQLWVEMPRGCSSISLYLKALERGIGVSPGPMYDIDGGYVSCFRLAYAHATAAELERAVQALSGIMREMLEKRTKEPEPTVWGVSI